MIRKEGREFVLFSKDGSRRLGTFKTRAEAEAREKKILAIKSLKQPVNQETKSGWLLLASGSSTPTSKSSTSTMAWSEKSPSRRR